MIDHEREDEQALWRDRTWANDLNTKARWTAYCLRIIPFKTDIWNEELSGEALG